MRILFIVNTDKRQRYRFVMEPLRRVDIDVRCFEEEPNPFNSFFRGIKAILSKPKSNVAVLTGGDLRNVIWLILLRVLTNIRIVVRFGGDPIAVRRSAQNSFVGNNKRFAVIRSRAGALGSRFLLKYVDGVIVVSDYLADSLRPMLGDGTHLVVSPPVLLSECRPTATYRQQEKSLNILTVANLNYEEKADGVMIVANAIKTVCQNWPELKIKFDVVGGGLQLSRLQRNLATTGLPNNLTFTLHDQQRDVSSYYESADLFVYHSTLDSYPLVLLEAVAHGLPLVINRWGPFSSIYNEGKSALFYETGNIKELENVIIRLAKSEKLRKTFGQSALKSYQENQSLVPLGIKLANFFQEVMR